MMAFEYLTQTIDLSPGITHLIIENKKLFRKTLLSLATDEGGDLFVVSEDFRPFDFKKKVFYFSDVLNISLSDKKISNKIISELESVTNELYLESLNDIKLQLLDLAEKLSFYFDYDYSYTDNLETSSLLKLLEFRVRDDSSGSLESLVLCVRILQKYLGIRLVMVRNLSLYYTAEEISELNSTFESIGFPLVNIECNAPMRDMSGKFVIIDEDLCQVIDTL